MPNGIQTDVDGLKNWLSLPGTPTTVQWQVREKGARTAGIGPTDFELIAVLEYSAADMEQLQSQMARQTSPADLYVANDFVAPWFPSDLEAAFATDSLYPDLLKLTAARYEPNLFTSGSLQHGYVVVAGAYVLVYLHTL